LASAGWRWLAGRLPLVQRFPDFGPEDRFIFADYIDDRHRIALYRQMVDATGVKTIFYCHDLVPVMFRQWVEPDTAVWFAEILSTFLRPGTLLLSNSAATMKDLQRARENEGLPRIDGIVIPPGSDLAETAPSPSAGPPPAFEHGYILYVSTIEVRKNHRLLLDAYARLIQRGMAQLPRLLFVGRRGWLVDDLLREIDSGSGAAAHVTILEDVPDFDLGRLYEGSLFTVYPSFYEGWGIPVSESLSFGKFCLCSDRGALPEAGAGLVELLDPTDAESWAERIAHYLEHPQEVRTREQDIRSNYRPRLWADFRRDAMAALARA
jgi:glycosyltransferase involved in cell wall biosynthesis